MAFVVVVGADEFRELAAQLRGPQNRAVRTRVGRAIRKEGVPVAGAVKRAVMATPSHTGSAGSASRLVRAQHNAARSRKGVVRLRGLRATIAAATGVQTNLGAKWPGVKIVVRRASMPPDQRRLPSRLNSASGWRHPVYGNRNNWVHQDGHPYFDVTVRRYERDFRRVIVRAVEQGARDVVRG